MRPFFVSLALLLAWLGCRKTDTPTSNAVPDSGPADLRPHLAQLGPRNVSNQTAQPLTVYGERFTAGLKLKLGEPFNRVFPLTVVDASHAYARLPGDLTLPASTPEVAVPVSLEGGTHADQTLRFINDAAFPDLVAMVGSRDGRRLFIASTTEDVLYVVDVDSKAVSRVAVGDGPSALAMWSEKKGREWVVVAHRYAAELRLVSVDGTEQRKIPAPATAASVVVDPALACAYVAEHARDSVVAVSLNGDGKDLWRTPVAPNPKPMALTPRGLWVGSLQTGQLELIDVANGTVREGPVQPGPGTPLIGPPTREMRRVQKAPSDFAQYIMGGKAPRDLVWSAKTNRLWLASIGPNIGPNPQKMEVTMNSGLALVDPEGRKWVRHVGFGAGVIDALALDEAAGLAYAADNALGLVRVVDMKKLAGSEGAAAKALLQDIGLPPPDHFPLVRPKEDFGVEDRAGQSLHSGPKALVLSPDRKTLYVLNRFTGTLAVLDVAQAAKGKAKWNSQTLVANTLGQVTRRLGQVLYHADFGRSAMTCDTCHLEGHSEGVLFEKTQPLRIYRSTTVRGSRETPPHFTPAAHWSVGETVKVVGSRNRYHNPALLPNEVEALTLYASGVVTEPNPFVGDDGAPVAELRLPDGEVGHPRDGMKIFEGKAGCVACHPPPHYTLDQDAKTRGKHIDVGTPHLVPLRPQMQDPHFEGFGPPSLLGTWDNFPLFTTGLAGLAAAPDGSLVVDDRFPLRKAATAFAPKHGRADMLNEQERNDLLAYVLSL